jgi:sporulation protein YlmC with PRC-barrel domain
MDIQVNAPVECRDGLCGRCTELILDPKTEQVTHLVVREDRAPHTQRLVPITQVLETRPHWIHLRCTRDELTAMEDYMSQEKVRVNVPLPYWPGEYTMQPIYISDTTEITLDRERVPQGEVALHRGARVHATDGPIGQVDEFLIDSTNGHITHLVLRVGHLWGKRDVTIPVSEIDRIEQDSIYLKLNKLLIGALPAVPVHKPL